MEKDKPDHNAVVPPASQGLGRYAHVLISGGLTALIGYLLYRDVPDWRQSFRVMAQGSPLWLAAAVCFVTLHMLLRARRWGVLLRQAKPKISFKSLFSLTLVKYAVNIIPPRSGEIAASVILAKKENISASTVVAASVFERILDTMTVLAIMMVYLVFFGHRFVPQSERGRQIIWAIQGYSVKILIVIIIGMVIVACLLRGAHWANRLPTRIRRIALQFVDGFRALKSRGAIVQVLCLSVAIWLSITLQTWCLVQAYLKPFPLAGAVLLLGLTVVGVAIPTPAGVGGFQYFMTLGLINFFGQYLSLSDAQSQAAGISNGCYITATIPVIIAGMVFLNTEGASLRRALRMSRQIQEANER